jgi:hypothetical protein
MGGVLGAGAACKDRQNVNTTPLKGFVQWGGKPQRTSTNLLKPEGTKTKRVWRFAV